VLSVMATEEKHVENRSATPKPIPSIASMIEINESKVDEFATDTPKAVDTARSPVVEVESLNLDGLSMNTQDANYIPLVIAESVTEQPETPSSKPEIAKTVQQNSIVSEDRSKPYIEKSRIPIASSTTEAREVTPGVEEEPKPQKNKGKKKKRKSTPKSDAGQSTTSLASKDSSETLKSSFMTESTENFVTALSSPNPSLTSGLSESCVCPADPPKSNLGAGTMPSLLEDKHQMDVKHSKTDSNASTSSTPTPMSTIKSGKQPRENHSKKGSNSSAVSTGSVRKTDINSTKSGGKTDENAKPASGDLLGDSQKENQPSSPAVNLDDPTQWPSLGPVKTSLSVVDGKPPAVPALQPLAERKKSPNAPIIPVVPLNMQRRRPS
jgi:hypothetical protein